MRSRHLLTAAALLCAMSASSRRLRAETYKIDNEHSSITFSVHQFLNVTRGRFKEFSGAIEVDRDHPERSSVVAHIQMKSIDTGIAKRDRHLLSDEFFDAVKYPTIDFRSTKVTRTGEQSADVAGDFTMHGLTKSIVLHVRLPDGKPSAQTHWEVATDPLKRRDFNLSFGSTVETVSGIGQEVSVKIDIVAAAANR